MQMATMDHSDTEPSTLTSKDMKADGTVETIVAHQNTTQMSQKGHAGHDELPDDQQGPGVQGGGHIEQPKDASLRGSCQVVVNHDKPKDHA